MTVCPGAWAGGSKIYMCIDYVFANQIVEPPDVEQLARYARVEAQGLQPDTRATRSTQEQRAKSKEREGGNRELARQSAGQCFGAPQVGHGLRTRRWA